MWFGSCCADAANCERPERKLRERTGNGLRTANGELRKGKQRETGGHYGKLCVGETARCISGRHGNKHSILLPFVSRRVLTFPVVSPQCSCGCCSNESVTT